MFGKKLLGGVALSAIAFASPVLAQETTSTIRGEVLNQNGDPVAGAVVSITHVPSGTVSQETTQGAGQFDIRGLRVGGPYRVEVKSDDYASQVIDDIYASLGDSSRIVIALEPVNDTVVVTATRRGVQILGSGSTQNRDDIQGTVAVTRDIRSLAQRDPLVSANTRSDGGISIAGSNPRTNRITIDGVQAQDSFGLNTGGLPTRRGPVSLDAIQSFTVSATPFDVSNGDFLGGAFDVVLRQGENDFDGSVFVNYLNEGLVGTRIRNSNVASFQTQENYGGTLRGPILQDKLFFALSYEYYTSADTTSTGPAGLGFGTNITGPASTAAGGIVPMTLADIAKVTDVFSTPAFYNSSFAFGSIPIAKGIVDEKYTGRVDWNINEDHRLSATYRYSESGVISRTNINATTAGLDSQWYLTGEEDTTMALQLNSNWTDRLSTEVRVSQRDYLRLQEPPSGQTFSDIRVCSTDASLDASGQTNPNITCRNGTQQVALVRFGPDQNRHANKLETQTRDAQATATYELGDHTLKLGGQWSETQIFNLFVPNSDGTYYFDSINDFKIGRANELIYRNALSNNPEDAAADFAYAVYSAVAQDTWDINDKLTLAYGVRYDRYSSDDKPANNVAFRNRYGFSNTETYDGRDVIMPRASFSYDANDNLQISGGVGLFSGGLPDVFISNSFSNTGVLDNTLTFQRSAAGVITELSGSVNCVATPTVCTDALNVPVNPNFGRAIPASVKAALGGSTISPFSETNSIDPDFEIPSDWRASVAVKLGLFDDWNIGLDLVAVRNQKALAYRDLRAQPLIVNGVQQFTPDGRIRYDGLSTAQRNSVAGRVVNSANLGNNRDIQAYNPSYDDNGMGYTAAISLSKEWGNGLDFGVSYARQQLDEFSSSARFSSTANSLYNSQFASRDPNTATKGTSQEEIEDNFKFNAGFRKQFVGELETRFSLFGTHREGRPSTFTMNGGANRNATFGVNRGAQLAYIPTLGGAQTTTSGTSIIGGVSTSVNTVSIASDSTVSFDSAATITSLTNLINQFGIAQGGIVDRSTYQNDGINLIDLQISQELPAWRDHRALLTFDIANLGNLLNEDWGTVREYGEDYRLFDVSCAGTDGIADDDGALTCNRYRISGVNTTNTRTTNTDASRWVIQIGLKYEF